MKIANKIEMWPVDRLKPYENNAKKHPPEQITRLAAMIVEFGFTSPILVDGKAGIIAGHGRLLAAKQLGMPEVPVIVLDYLTDAQRRACIIADNRVGETGWDEAILAAEIEALAADSFDLELTGFDQAELDRMLSDATEDGQEPTNGDQPSTENPSDGGQESGNEDGDGGEIDDPSDPPNDFNEYDEEIKTDYCCPNCGYQWSGKPK